MCKSTMYAQYAPTSHWIINAIKTYYYPQVPPLHLVWLLLITPLGANGYARREGERAPRRTLSNHNRSWQHRDTRSLVFPSHAITSNDFAWNPFNRPRAVRVAFVFYRYSEFVINTSVISRLLNFVWLVFVECFEAFCDSDSIKIRVKNREPVPVYAMDMDPQERDSEIGEESPVVSNSLDSDRYLLRTFGLHRDSFVLTIIIVHQYLHYF